MCAVSGCYWPPLPKQTKTRFSNPEPCNFFLRNCIIIFRHAMLCKSASFNKSNSTFDVSSFGIPSKPAHFNNRSKITKFKHK